MAPVVLLLGCVYEAWTTYIPTGRQVRRWIHLATAAGVCGDLVLVFALPGRTGIAPVESPLLLARGILVAGSPGSVLLGITPRWLLHFLRFGVLNGGYGVFCFPHLCPRSGPRRFKVDTP